MYNVGMIKFKKNDAGVGALVAIEGQGDIPFSIARVYYITGVPQDAKRGAHAHRKLHQVLICLNGSVTIKVDNAGQQQEFLLDDPGEGLYIGPKVWREMYNFSPESVLMVLASATYDELDYIRDYHTYLQDTRGFFDKGETR